MKPQEAWRCVSALQIEAVQLKDNEDKANAFTDSLFPKIKPSDPRPLVATELELPWKSSTAIEIQRALNVAKKATQLEEMVCQC